MSERFIMCLLSLKVRLRHNDWGLRLIHGPVGLFVLLLWRKLGAGPVRRWCSINRRETTGQCANYDNMIAE